jgi:hypothetical protein
MATLGFSSCAERELRQFLPLFRWLLLVNRHDPQEAQTKGAGVTECRRNVTAGQVTKRTIKE